MKKQISIIFLVLVIAMVVSGCAGKKQNNIKPEVFNNQVQEQSSQVATSSSLENNAISSEAIDMSDWQTYKNSDYGFEFKYPKNWEYRIMDDGFIELKDNEMRVYFEGSETYLVRISTISFNNSNDLNEYLKKWQIGKEKDGWVKNVKINNINTIQGNNFFGLDTIIINSEKNIIIKIVKGQFSPEYKPLDNLYINLISSWKFNK